MSHGPPVLIEEDSALPLVYLGVSLLSGAVEDPQGKEGLTRLMTRLMRRTGGGLSSDELDVRIDSLGGSLGVEVALSTAGFSAAVIARSLDAFVDLLSEVLARPGFSEEEFERLKRETLTELVEMRDHDRSLVRHWFRRKLFENHAYGRSVTGSRTTLEQISLADVQTHYRRVVTKNNLILGFAGDISAERANGAVESLTHTLGDGPRQEDTTPEPESLQGRRLVIVDKPERTQTQILIGGLGTKASDPDHTALNVANTVLGGTFTARLTQEVRSKRGWSYGAYSSLPYDRRRHGFSMWTFPKAEDAAACIELELQLLSSWIRDGITEDELNWTKSYLMRSHAFNIDTAAKRVGLKLDEAIYDLPVGYHDSYLERIASVTVAEANQAIRQRISDENLLITVVGTESAIGDGIRSAIDNLAHTEVVPYDTE